ncbi:hypothetical protein [Sagittula sp. S175]|uniref:hypothetical protein n=1 Tax=Sagittula sp. S175 TaxID=3415129 RepID=UPI003C7A9FC3
MSEFRSQMEASIWAKVKDLPQFYWADLIRFNVAEDTARKYVRRWAKSKRIREVRMDGPKVYWVNAERQPEPGQTVLTHVATPEGNMWRTMRRMGSFSPLEIAMHANAGGIEVTLRAAQEYCRQLLTVGYLKVRQTAIPGRRQAIYQLIRNTGPQAPVVRRVSGVSDPNDGTFQPLGGR